MRTQRKLSRLAMPFSALRSFFDCFGASGGFHEHAAALGTRPPAPAHSLQLSSSRILTPMPELSLCVQGRNGLLHFLRRPQSLLAYPCLTPYLASAGRCHKDRGLDVCRSTLEFFFYEHESGASCTRSNRSCEQYPGVLA